MSDDEYYYDDDDDWYWYEDDCMGLGVSFYNMLYRDMFLTLVFLSQQDELAETAVHSPIMVEDPSLETVDTYSDWEYYSDDYYDDDPTIITKQKSEGGGESHKKKRKLSTLENIPSLSLGSSVVDYPTAMTSSFKGVLWRLPIKEDEKVELYEPGKGEKVALLSNWREVFKAPRYRKDWFANGPKTNGHENESQRVDKQDASVLLASTGESPEFGERNTNVEFSRYSPPPDAIENMDESISRQRVKHSQPDLTTKTTSHPLAETMFIADSEEEIDEEVPSPVAVAKVDVADEEDKENASTPEKEKQHPGKMSIRVEIPTLAAALKRDSANKSTPPCKRGRKPKSSSTTAATKPNATNDRRNKREVKHEQPASKPAQMPAKNGHSTAIKKRKKHSDLEELEQDDSSNKRRSKRVASSATNNNDKKAAQAELDKKRTRTASSTSSMEGCGKRRKV
ncbi:hypothetical protein UA08_03840 [Talaromyces atroroseus]|uniref:Uncharacterized protein n=1 Tax=Talaromyces atroroseus TaxID=1441469 RepID=A0A225AHW9_TALAT|nr:hypothetical protein UA08_03840 [Talaromyces atroroseus]OKL61042.1 hypothetical protein UA08_03840 [Talaromyces atroroseus]